MPWTNQANLIEILLRYSSAKSFKLSEKDRAEPPQEFGIFIIGDYSEFTDEDKKENVQQNEPVDYESEDEYEGQIADHTSPRRYHPKAVAVVPEEDTIQVHRSFTEEDINHLAGLVNVLLEGLI